MPSLREARKETYHPVAIDQVRSAVQHIRVPNTAALPFALFVDGFKLDVPEVQDTRQNLPNLRPRAQNIKPQRRYGNSSQSW